MSEHLEESYGNLLKFLFLISGTSRELLDGELVVLEELKIAPPPLPSTLPPTNGAKAQSLTNLTSGLKLSVAPEESLTGIDDEGEERAKSLEFLLDEKKKSAVSVRILGTRV